MELDSDYLGNLELELRRTSYMSAKFIRTTVLMFIRDLRTVISLESMNKWITRLRFESKTSEFESQGEYQHWSSVTSR